MPDLNRRASLDDEYFRLVLTAQVAVEKHPEAKAANNIALRSLERPESAKLRSELVSRMSLEPVTGPGGLYLGEHPAFTFEHRRVHSVVERVVMGLHYHTNGVPLPSNRFITAHDTSTLTDESPNIQMVWRRLAAFLDRQRQNVIAGGSFVYSCGRPTEDDATAWLLRFYEAFEFIAIDRPANSNLVRRNVNYTDAVRYV